MKEVLETIEIIVDFDGIVKNLPGLGKNCNSYKNCDDFVKYNGKSVDGTNIKLYKDKSYLFILEKAVDNQSNPTKLRRFKDDDLVLSRVIDSPLILECNAVKENKKGKDVTIKVHFDDENGQHCKASWDPKIIVDIDPD